MANVRARRAQQHELPAGDGCADLPEAGEIQGVFAPGGNGTSRRRREDALVRLNRELVAIVRCSRSMLRAADEETLLADVCSTLCEAAGYRMACVWYLRADEAQTARLVACAGPESNDPQAPVHVWADASVENNPSRARGGETAPFAALGDDPLRPPWGASALARGSRSAVGLALNDDQGRPLGLLAIYSALPDVFTPDGVRRLEGLAADLAFSITAIRTRADRDRVAMQREQLDRFFSLSTDAMCIAAPAGNFVQVNPALVRMLGYGEDELISRPFLDFVVPEDRERTAREVELQMAIRPSLGFENRYRRKDGSVVDISWTAYYDAEDDVTYATGRDITERKVAEARVRAASDYARGLIEASLDPLVTISPTGVITDVNEATERATGVLRERLIGTDFADYFTAPALAREGYEAVLVLGVVRDYPLTIRHASGRTTDVLYNATVYRNSDGGVEGVFAAARDVTERKVAEEAQRRLNRELRAISDCNEALMRAEDEATLLGQVCSIICDKAGYRMAWVGYADADDRSIRPAAWAGIEDGYLTTAEFSWADDDLGHGAAGTAIRTGETVYVHDIAMDPRMRPWREQALSRGYRSTVAVPLRDEARQVFGVLAIFAADIGAFSSEELRLIEELAADLAYGVTTLRAREAQRRLEAQLRQAQKMDVVGQLAGGIAHDFNNLLTAIAGYGGFLEAELPEDDERCRNDLAEMLSATERARSLTQQLLSFSRRQVLEPVVVEAAEVVEEIAPMLRRVLGEQIELVTSAGPDPAPVRVDRGQLEQVIVNLAVNARDAMPDGGRLAIQTSVVHLDEAYASEHPDVAAGEWVSITVSDTGTGMTEETISHAFEPFFTTKPEGKGTGLGLATVYGIVRQSGGSIAMHSVLGAGTDVHVYLPRLADDDITVGPETREQGAVVGGTETVLVVEDDPAVRTYARRVLVGLGYTVVEAPNGAEALGVVAAHGGRIDLLLTDIVMPGLQGIELARRVTTTWQDIRVVYMSGFADGRPGQTELLANGPFLPKPFTATALGRIVRSVLDGAAAR